MIPEGYTPDQADRLYKKIKKEVVTEFIEKEKDLSGESVTTEVQKRYYKVCGVDMLVDNEDVNKGASNVGKGEWKQEDAPNTKGVAARNNEAAVRKVSNNTSKRNRR